MSPKHKLITLTWCAVTMLGTLVLSHGHMIMREILAHWPEEDSWEGRLENAMYTQGGLTLVASLIVSVALLVRGYFVRHSKERVARRELAVRERHERSAAERHFELLESLRSIRFTGGSGTEARAKKSVGSGIKPR